MSKSDFAVTLALGFGLLVAMKYLTGQLWPAAILNVAAGIIYARLPRESKP